MNIRLYPLPFFILTFLIFPQTYAVLCKDITSSQKGIIHFFTEGRKTHPSLENIPLESLSPAHGRIISKDDFANSLGREMGLTTDQVEQVLHMVTDSTILFESAVGLSVWDQGLFALWGRYAFNGKEEDSKIANYRILQLYYGREASTNGFSPFWIEQLQRAGKHVESAWMGPLSIDENSIFSLSSTQRDISFEDAVLMYIQNKSITTANEDARLVARFPWSFSEDQLQLVMKPKDSVVVNNFLRRATLVENTLIFDGEGIHTVLGAGVDPATQMLLTMHPELFPLARGISERARQTPQPERVTLPMIGSPASERELLRGKVSFGEEEVKFNIFLYNGKMGIQYLCSCENEEQVKRAMDQAVVEVLKVTRPYDEVVTPRTFYTFEADALNESIRLGIRNLGTTEALMIVMRANEILDPDYLLEVHLTEN